MPPNRTYQVDGFGVYDGSQGAGVAEFRFVLNGSFVGHQGKMSQGSSNGNWVATHTFTTGATAATLTLANTNGNRNYMAGCYIKILEIR